MARSRRRRGPLLEPRSAPTLARRELLRDGHDGVPGPGDVRDGAPTHHPERALSPLWWVLVAMGVDTIDHALCLSKGGRSRVCIGLLAVGALAWLAYLPSRLSRPPGETEADRRDGPIARGLDMRSRNPSSADITPCSFEHFALIAAWGRPEAANILPSLHRPPTSECPLVEEH